jgi:hypothetical protein
VPEAAHISTASFVRSHLNGTNVFLGTAIPSVEETPVLQSVNKRDTTLAGRDTLQFSHSFNRAFRPVPDTVTAFQKSLKFTIDSRKAALAADSLQIDDIAKGSRAIRGARLWPRSWRAGTAAALVAKAPPRFGAVSLLSGCTTARSALHDESDGEAFAVASMRARWLPRQA